MTNAGSEENKERKDWRYVCQDCDFVTMDADYAEDHEDAERHTVIRNRQFKEKATT